MVLISEMLRSSTLISTLFSFKIQVFANRFKLMDDHKADLTAIRIASVNPILDPWIYILLRRSLFRRLLSLSRRGGRSSRSSSTQRTMYMFPDLTADSHVFTHLMFNANVISQLPDTVKFTLPDTESLCET